MEMEECRVDIVHKSNRHRELLGHEAALTQTKERIAALAEKVDTITAIWRVVSLDPAYLPLACPLHDMILNRVRMDC